MKVKDVLDKSGIYMRYASDRKLTSRNRDAEVLAFGMAFSGKWGYDLENNNSYRMVWKDEKEAYSFAFIFKSARAGLVGVLNGQRVEPKIAYAFIRQLGVEKEFEADKVEKALILEAL